MKVFCNFWVGYYLFEFKTSCVASHENYNNVSCILDVCLLCAMLCAGRFGLGWAHDEFIFACHMFMHSHAYVPSILYLVISTVWDFYDCLPLFLSFSPSYVNCVMAPKRKSTPSRNPLHSGASSSSSPSDPTPSHVWFHDEKAKSDFFENFSWRGIHSDRQVILLDFSDTDLPTVIYSKGWESLCGAPVTCPSVII